MENLWDKIAIEKTEPTPKEALITQATFLSEMTNGKLVGSIKTTTGSPYINPETDEFGTECFIHTFRINAPNLGYTFTLLKLVHDIMKVYPFKIISSLDSVIYHGEDNQELNVDLKSIFTSPIVTESMKSLLSQSQLE